MSSASYTIHGTLYQSPRTRIFQAEEAGEPVIVKRILGPATRTAFSRERDITQRAEGPGVLRLIHANAPDLIFEDFGGRALDTLTWPLALDDVLHVAIAVTQALNLHRHPALSRRGLSYLSGSTGSSTWLDQYSTSSVSDSCSSDESTVKTFFCSAGS